MSSPECIICTTTVMPGFAYNNVEVNEDLSTLFFFFFWHAILIGKKDRIFPRC